MDGSRDEYTLFGEPINDHEDRITTRGCRKGFNEVHGDGVPRTFGNGELLQQTVRLVTLGFSSHTGCTRLTVLLYEFTESGPSIISKDETSCFVLAGMTGKYVVMFVLKDAEPKVGRVGNVDAGVMTEESIGTYGPVRFRIGEMGFIKRVGGKCCEDIGIELFLIHDNGSSESWL